jgi:hypothetical protein
VIDFAIKYHSKVYAAMAYVAITDAPGFGTNRGKPFPEFVPNSFPFIGHGWIIPINGKAFRHPLEQFGWRSCPMLIVGTFDSPRKAIILSGIVESCVPLGRVGRVPINHKTSFD